MGMCGSGTFTHTHTHTRLVGSVGGSEQDAHSHMGGQDHQREEDGL